MSATVMKAEQLRTKQGGARGAEAMELADVFCRQASLRVDRLFDGLWNNTDAVDTKVSADLLAGKYTWLDEGIVDLTEGTGPWISDESFGPSQVPDVRRNPYATV